MPITKEFLLKNSPAMFLFWQRQNLKPSTEMLTLYKAHTLLEKEYENLPTRELDLYYKKLDFLRNLILEQKVYANVIERDLLKRMIDIDDILRNRTNPAACNDVSEQTEHGIMFN